ncbi:hypothetical protein [Granulicella paludicola]|jgi:hypothetical protein|uniref:hypothetical protein n=1 Tax=Granulicella paludicola TaxID=474951 RepID=UPI0021E01392|nr:hypothetical protein [Granulicella paludicola]
MIQAMKVSRSLRKLGNQIGDQIDDLTDSHESSLLRTVGWVSAGVTAVALGLIVGREIRQRYKFNRRTPYDFYAHSGDQVQDVDFGVGI